jgi:hypothetical protein
VASYPYNGADGVYASGSSLYVASNNGVSVSTDGGANWTNYSNGYQVDSVYASGSNVYAGTYYGGLLISNDNGQTYTTRNGANSNLGDNDPQFQGDRVRAVYVDQAGTIYAGTGNGLSISTDGGTSFHNVLSGVGYPDGVTGVYASGGNIYATILGVGLAVSTNSGATFTYYGTAEGLGDTGVWGVHAVGDTIYVATGSGVSISRNGAWAVPSASSFSTTTNGLGSPLVFGGVYAIGSTVYAATTSGLSISTDGGANFTNYALSGNIVSGVYATGNKVYASEGSDGFGPPGGLSVGVG